MRSAPDTADPPRVPSDTEWRRILALAPRIFVQRSEPFPLKAAAAIVHPSTGTIAYHLFWDDDIDFPDDNDPSDHEVVWITSAPNGGTAGIRTYFHGRILTCD